MGLKARIVTVLAALILALSLVIVFDSYYHGGFYPGVVFGGERIGGKTYGEALATLNLKAESVIKDGLSLSFTGAKGKVDIHIPMSSAGLTSDNSVEYFSIGDWDVALSEAYQWGRQGSIFRRAAEKIGLVFRDKHFELPVSLHEAPIRSLLARELEDFFKPAVPARFSDNGSAVTITSERAGEGVDLEAVLSQLRTRFASLNAEQLTFDAAPLAPEVTKVKLAPFLEFANELARTTKIVFSYKDRHWRVSGATWVSWLTLDKDDLVVDSKKLESYLTKTVAAAIDSPPIDSRFQMVNGFLVEILPGKAGNVVDIKKTAGKVEQIVQDVQRSFALTSNLSLAFAAIAPGSIFKPQSGEVEILIETVRAEPKVTQKTIDDYKIKDLVGVSRTSFKGSSADRRTNIIQGVAKLNGLLLPPEGEFSAVEAIGEVTEEAGFVKEFVIKATKSVKELGGGLCQIATTLFRMALDAGLQITERVNHRYVVGYYGPGLDATIYGPHPDLKFVNDTGNYILLQGRVENDELVLELYGQRDGRKVSITDPVITEEKPAPPPQYTTTTELPLGTVQCSEQPRKGMTTDVTYTVTHADGEVHEQQFQSVYQPWQKVCLIGIGI